MRIFNRNSFSVCVQKGGKRVAVAYGNQHGSGSSMASSSAKTASSKKTVAMSSAVVTGSITSPNTLRSPTPQPITTNTIQQFPIMNASGNHLVQFIQGSQLITQQPRSQIIQQTTQQQPPQQQHHHHQQQPHQIQQHQQQQQQQPPQQQTTLRPQSHNQHLPTNTSKQNKLPQQILPKPSILNSCSVAQTSTATAKSVITQPKNVTPASMALAAQQTQLHQSVAPSQTVSSQHQQQNQTQPIVTTTQPPPQPSPIILPTGNLNHPLLLNQMPVIVHQNAPQGVQLILRPPTPQLATPSLVIHNSRPQIQTQQQPQQLLRIVNANGQMQLATATPTFIVSSQSNLIQQNLQGIKGQTTNPLNQLQGLTSQGPQQIAAAINSQIIGRSMAQIQNLQLNGNLAQIQMPNGLNGQFISQLPAQFQQSVTGFNQFNQLSSTNFQQLAATATGTAFQSPPPGTPQPNDMVMTGPNIQFTTQQSVAQSIPSSQIIAMPQQQTQLIPTSVPTPEPIRNPTPITILPGNTVIVPDSPKTIMPPIIHTQSAPVETAPVIQKTAKKAKKPKAKKTTTPIQSVSIASSQAPVSTMKPTYSQSAVVQPTTQQVSTNALTNTSQSIAQAPLTSTGKLDLANVMKLCGIMDDDDFMDTDDMPSSNAYEMSNNGNNAANDIMVTIPYSNSDTPFSFTIPNVESNIAMNDQSSMKTSTVKAYSECVSSAPISVVTSMAENKTAPDRQYMIKIDNNDGTTTFPLSISLPASVGTIDRHHKGASNVNIQMDPIIRSNSIRSTDPTPMVTPTLQSQINEIQNQLIGVVNTSTNSIVNTSMPAMTTTTTVNAVAPIVSNAAAKTTKKKQSNKRNGKKVIETINVPSQIGNIQISQVDRTKVAQNNSGKTTAIENRIQITPIMDKSLDDGKCTRPFHSKLLSSGIKYCFPLQFLRKQLINKHLKSNSNHRQLV